MYGYPCRVRWPTLYLGFVFFLVATLMTPAKGEQRGLRIVDAANRTVGWYKASYALVIGISDYTNGWPDLRNVEKDITQVKTALVQHGFEVMVVHNPTRLELLEAFDAFIVRYGLDPGHRLVIYYAGHGHTIKRSYGEETGYIVPANAPNPHQDRQGFLATALSMQQIEVYATRIEAKHVLFLFDSCFSGSIFSLSRSVPENISYKTSNPVRQFITSGSAEEVVPDESIFRQQFLAALRGEADFNGDGYLTGTELGEFLQGTVVNYSKSAQHPQYGKIRNPNLNKGDFVFKIENTISPGGPTFQVKASGQPASTMSRQPADVGPDPEAEMWALIKDSPYAADVSAFIDAYPNGRFAPAARLKLVQLQRPSNRAGQTQEAVRPSRFNPLEFPSEIEAEKIAIDKPEQRCSPEDVAGIYKAAWGPINCKSAGAGVECCYSSSCKWTLRLGFVDGGRVLEGIWDHNDGRTGPVRFNLNDRCELTSGKYGYQPGNLTSAWSVYSKLGNNTEQPSK